MHQAGERAASEASALIRRIPAFPPVAIRVLGLLQDDDVAVDRLVELIRSDPAFAGELLRRANSPLLACHSEVASLEQALILLGYRRVRALALTVATGMYLRKAADIGELRKFWRYSLACALLSEELARACGVHEDVAYTAGLLHDIGRLGLMVAHPEQYAHLIRYAGEQLRTGQPVDIVQLERDLFGVDHYEVGRCLAEAWKLPEPLAEIAGRHPRAVAQEWNTVRIVRLGCQLAIALGFGVLPSPHNPSLETLLGELPEPVRKRLPADPCVLGEEICRKLAELDIESFGSPEPKLGSGAARAPRPGQPSASQTCLTESTEVASVEDDANDGGTGVEIREVLPWLLVAALSVALLLMVLLKFVPA
jgi:putative nucleotidyltransferase with HDIG domain